LAAVLLAVVAISSAPSQAAPPDPSTFSIVAADGASATATGSGCQAWAGGRHGTTFTAVGRATLFTGVDPRRHGLVANVWLDRT